MKKIVFALSLFISALFLTITMTQPVFAAHSSGWDIVKDTTYPERYYLTKNGSRDIPNEGSSSSFDFAFEGLNNVVGFKFYFHYSPTVTYLIGTYSGQVGVVSTFDFMNYPDTVEIGVNDYEWFVSNFETSGDQVNQYYFTDFVFAAPADTHRPAITGEENYATSVNDLRPLSFFQDFLVAYDETDGDITSDIIVVSDGYTANMAILGKYPVTFSVSDAAGNVTTLLVYINVVDMTSPVISGNTAVAEISYTQTWNIATFKSTLTVSDNYYTLTNSNIVVESDNYTANKTVPGTYTVVYSATDTSGNKGTFTKQVKVIDDVAPVISGTSVITKPSNSILTVANIQAQLSANDFIEGNKTSQITVKTDGFTGFGNVVGSYSITFEVADSKGNKSTYLVTVNVVDNIAPIIFIRDGVSIVLKADEVLTRDQIISILQVTEQVQNVTQTTQFSFLIDEYQGNEEVPGIYMMSVKVSNVSGNESVHNLMINVLEGDTPDDVVVDAPVVEWYQHIWNFVVAAFNFVIDVLVNIWNFIVGIWNWIVGLFNPETASLIRFINRI